MSQSEESKGPTQFSLTEASTQTSNEQRYREQIGAYFEQGAGTTLDRLNNFARFVPRQALSLFLAKHELFQHVLPVHGNIVECGVFLGGGLFSWAQFSAIHEPVNHGRKVIGFDTFDGFPAIGAKDQGEGTGSREKVVGGYRFDGRAELETGVKLFDLNRHVGHIPKLELVPGDANVTIPQYLEENPHLVVALLYLDFDLYEPTRTALRAFLPRMPAGAVLAFDELNQRAWPGETLAVLEEVGLRKLHIRRFPFTPALSYAVLDS
jgi:hypothetical protein